MRRRKQRIRDMFVGVAEQGFVELSDSRCFGRPQRAPTAHLRDRSCCQRCLWTWQNLLPCIHQELVDYRSRHHELLGNPVRTPRKQNSTTFDALACSEVLPTLLVDMGTTREQFQNLQLLAEDRAQMKVHPGGVWIRRDGPCNVYGQ